MGRVYIKPAACLATCAVHTHPSKKRLVIPTRSISSVVASIKASFDLNSARGGGSTARGAVVGQASRQLFIIFSLLRFSCECVARELYVWGFCVGFFSVVLLTVFIFVMLAFCRQKGQLLVVADLPCLC